MYKYVGEIHHHHHHHHHHHEMYKYVGEIHYFDDKCGTSQMNYLLDLDEHAVKKMFCEYI